MALGSITNPFSNNTQSNYVNDSFDERILLAKQFCEENKVTQLENILKSGVSVNTLVPQFQYKKVRRNNVPLLSISVARNSIDCVKLLVKYGANIEAKDSIDCRPLHWACTFGRLHIVSFLLESGADPNPTDPAILVPLLYTCKFGYSQLAERLLESNASVNQQEGTGRSALHFAAWFGYSNLMQILLNYKAIVNLTDHDNRTPLHYASWFNHKDCCDLLIKNGAVVDFQDQDGRTPLHFAVMHNHNEVAQLLLTSNANYKLKTNGGKTAESIAMANNNNEIIDLLQKLESKVMSDNVVSTNNDKTEKTEIKSASHQSLPNNTNTNTNTNVSNNSTDEDDDLRSRKEIITEHQKIKQIIAKLVELKDSQFNECNAIREQLDNHVMLINVFTQNQQEIVQQINRLSELVQQIVVTLNLGVQLEQSHSSGMIGKTSRQPISQTTSNLVPSSTPNSVNLPLAESRSFEGQNPKISSVIDPLNSFDNNGNIRLSAGNITVNDQGSYSQPTTTSQSEINEDKDMYININFTKQQLKKQQAAQPTPTPCVQQPQQLSAITSSNGVPLCAYCKKNAATFRCKVCHAPFCNTCLPYIKQKCCPFCQKPQTQGSQANP